MDAEHEQQNEDLEQMGCVIHPVYQNYGFSRGGELPDGEISIYNIKTRHQICPKKQNNGYQSISISTNNSVRTIMLSRFIFECQNQRLISDRMVIDHIDGDIKNNDPTNLQEISQSENLRKRKPYKHEVKRKVESTDCTDDTTQEFSSAGNAARALGITHQRIKDCCKNVICSTKSKTNHHWYTFKYV
jgi:hypothetical protein